MKVGEVAERAGVNIETIRYYERRGLLPEPLRTPSGDRLLHVTNGESAGNTLRQTGLGGAVLPWQDVLHEGPVPLGVRSALLRARAEFLSGCGWGSRAALQASLEERDATLLEALEGGRQVVLWFEHDLYDQLQLLDVLALAHEAGVAPELIVVDSFPGKPSFHGLGELTADELATLWPGRVAASEAQLNAAAAAWAAFRAPDLDALRRLAQEGVEGLPLVAPALRRLLEELPAAGDGLSRTERQALEAVAAGAATPIQVFLASQEREEAPYLGDAWFFRILAALGRGPERLLAAADGEPLPAPPPLGDAARFVRLPIRLTPRGEEVLAGRADRVELVPLDRWLGGKHVTGDTAFRR